MGIVFITVSNLFAIYPAQITRFTIDYVSSSYQKYSIVKDTNLKDLLFSSYSKVFLFFFLIIIVSTLLKGLFMFFMRQTIIIMSRLIEFDMKNEVFKKYQALDLPFYRKNNTGDLMARISEDVSQVRMYTGPAIMYSINLIVLFILVIAAMVNISPILTFYVLLPLPFLSFGVYYVSNKINAKSKLIQKQVSTLSTFVQEAFSGIRVIKAFNREAHSVNELKNESEKYKELSLSLVRTDALFQPVITLLIGLSSIFTIYVGGLEAIKGNITLGNIAEFVIYVNMLVWPVTAIGWVSSIIQKAAASQTRINEFLDTKSSIQNDTSINTIVNGKIEFKNVSFTYPDSRIVALKNVSFIINKGETLAVIGKTGSGKSTIAALVCGLYSNFEGEILIDDKPIKQQNIYDLRKQIGYVPQDVFLFSDSIKNNIAFGFEDAKINLNTEKIIQAAKDACVYENIIAFADGFDTKIGERGVTLSGGQKQRLSIARAIIKNPELLIFDDCLSAVDTETESKILKNLKHIMKGKTSILISHRVSTVKNATNIIVIEDGEIVEKGSHAKLTENKGVYYNLYQSQLLKNEFETIN